MFKILGTLVVLVNFQASTRLPPWTIEGNESVTVSLNLSSPSQRLVFNPLIGSVTGSACLYWETGCSDLKITGSLEAVKLVLAQPILLDKSSKRGISFVSLSVGNETFQTRLDHPQVPAKRTIDVVAIILYIASGIMALAAVVLIAACSEATCCP